MGRTGFNLREGGVLRPGFFRRERLQVRKRNKRRRSFKADGAEGNYRKPSGGEDSFKPRQQKGRDRWKEQPARPQEKQ